MKKLILISAVALALSAPALAGSMKELRNYQNIEVGQSKADVAVIMHEPGNRELNGNREAWQYCARDGSMNKFVVVYFKDGNVEKLATYNKRWLGGCSGQYKPVVWDTVEKPSDTLAGQ